MKTRQKWPEKLRGHSLVEYIIGSGVMTFVLAASFSAVGQSQVMSENVRTENVAIEVLRSELEHLRTLSWSDFDKLARTGRFERESFPSDIPFKQYAGVREIRPLGDYQKEVRLIFTWSTTKGNKTKRRELVAYFTKEGLYDFDYRAF